MFSLLYNLESELLYVYSVDINYYNIFLNIFFLSIIMIILIIFFWDNIYKLSKKKSKCNEILNIIRENEIIEKPYIYSVIIINNDVIDATYSNYILKIIYDFKNMKTRYEYGNDNGKENDIFNNDIIKGNNLVDAKNSFKNRKNPEYQMNYFDLRTMKNEKIDGINIKVLNSAKYKYVNVDENNDKVKNNSSSFSLLVFTKKYSENGNYNKSIIDDIIFSKNNREKLKI